MKTPYIYKAITLLFIFIAQCAYTQTNEAAVTRALIIGKDTLPHIKLDDIIVLPPLEFKSKKEYIKYTKLVRNIKKVYPYSKEAARIFKDVHYALDTIESRKARRAYVNKKDKELQDKYGPELKRLSMSQGRLLIKLVDRETGFSSYEIIKELKGSFSAFMWQQVARMFGSSLKTEFDADGEDKYINRIVIMIEQGMI